MYDDVTKNTADKGTYNSESSDLMDQLASLATDTKFNGITLFNAAGTKDVFLSVDNPTNKLTIDDTDFSAGTKVAAMIAQKDDLSHANMASEEISLALGEITLRDQQP